MGAKRKKKEKCPPAGNEEQVLNTPGGCHVPADEKLIIVSCDCHIGPRLKEDLRPYCPQEYLDQFDDFVRYFDETNPPNPWAEPGFELGTSQQET